LVAGIFTPLPLAALATVLPKSREPENRHPPGSVLIPLQIVAVSGLNAGHQPG
jgi:hypothetical protein